MADTIQTLKLQSDPTTNVYPNVKAENIPTDAIDEDKLADASVTEDKLADASVTNSKLATGAVTSTKLASLSVTNAKLAASAVTTGKITDSAVTNNKIADNAVTAAKLSISLESIYSTIGTTQPDSQDIESFFQERLRSVKHLGFRYITGSGTGIVAVFEIYNDWGNSNSYYRIGNGAWTQITDFEVFWANYSQSIYELRLG